MGRIVLTLFSFALLSLALAQAPAYFIQADAVRGAQGAQGAVCVANAVFLPGESVIFRAVVTDAATGEPLGHEEIEARGITATVHVDGLDDIQMFFPPVEEGTPDAMYFFRGPWYVPADMPMGDYGWNVEVRDADGNVATFAPIGAAIGMGAITILAGQ